MGLGQKLSVNIAPLLLRTGLAATFIWIGTPMLRTMELTPQQTAQLANAEIRSPTPASTTNPAPAPSESPDPPAIDDGITTPPPLTGVSLTGRPNPPQPTTEPDALAEARAAVTPVYTADQFTGSSQQSRRWVLVSLAALDAAQPVDDDDDTTEDRSVLPASVGSGGLWVKVGSIAFALIVAIGGYAVILGFFTRVWALLLALCTGLSMWVLEIGPTWAAREGFLGFIPDPQLLDPDAALVVWMRLILHLMVLMTALALLILGPGKLSADALMFRGSGKHRSGSFDGDSGHDD